MKIWTFLLLACMILTPLSIGAQNEAWFYLRAKDTLFNPTFQTEEENIRYVGNDQILAGILENYSITKFKKTFKHAKKEDLKRTFFVMADSPQLMTDLLQKASHIFNFGELISEEDKKIFEPNDYGLTSTIGDNTGLPINLDYMDFMGVPKAWYYTTGERDIVIGVSDAYVDSTDTEFKGKMKMYRKAPLAKGHGISQAANMAAQGDNGYGMPGICYDCSIASTTYGDFQNFAQLLELSRAGVKVINCSWVGTRYYETAQAAIDEMYANGTVIVASAGNKDWLVTKGNLLYYPASYDKVISVSSGMYKHENLEDNILISPKGNPYAANIRGYIGRTVGFKGHDTKKEAHIYPVSVATLNREVDLLAPTVGLFAYSRYVLKDELWYSPSETTSGASPQVSGTIGLMLSLYPCLPIDEVESILKMTAMNVDHIPANRAFEGNYGAGMLQTGGAVKMVHDLYSTEEVTYIENQQFTRWNFKITAHSKEVVLRNQKFTENATLEITAKNSIVIGQNTVLKPNEEGSIHLKIDLDLNKECDLRLRTDKTDE